MNRLLDRVADIELLRTGWNALLASDREDGALKVGVSRFLADADERLAAISAELAQGTYRPSRLARVELPRPSGSARVLQVPCVRDRIVERAVLAEITPYIDPWLGPSSFGYRPGLGVADAIQAVATLRDEGLPWVIRADVDDCFPNMPVGRARRMLGALLPDTDLLALIDALLARRSIGQGGERAVKGLAQGSPLSPVLANLVLTGLDERLAEAGFPVVRYADDFVAFASTRQEAGEAMRVASEAANDLELRLGADKSAVMSFEEGFCFLGEDFGPRYPVTLDDHRVVEPPRRVVYVGLQGCRVRIEAGRLLVQTSNHQELLDVPSGQIERLVCWGSVGVSAGVRAWALSTGVDLVFLSRRGSYQGHAWAAASRTRVTRLRAQLAATADDQRRLQFGRAVIEAKIQKQVVLLQRLGRRHNAEVVAHAAEQMRQLLILLPDATNRNELMGIEGAAARQYFAALGATVPDELAFHGRSRRPPLDTVNAALSYLYALLLSETVGALCGAGLDPSIGFLHADEDHRPSLALDLMEEFRPLVVDQVVISAIARRELRPEHGRREEGTPGVQLTKAGREAVIGGYERRMLQMTRGALPGFSGSLRRHLHRQAERVAAVVQEPSAVWTGLSWR